MSNTYKDKKVRHTQELRRSGASGFHSPSKYKRKEKYPDKELKFYTKNSKVGNNE